MFGQPSGRQTLLFARRGPANKLTRRRVEAKFSVTIRTPIRAHVINVTTNRDGTHRAHFTIPLSLRQEIIHAAEIQQISLPLWTVGAARNTSLWVGLQRWFLFQGGTRKILVEKDLALLQRLPERLVAFEDSPLEHLTIPRLVRAFGGRLVGRTVQATELELYPQSQ